ncbi:MAG: mechanosensitive ion channel domain-containing protein [Candidatus Woesearchaeota archaeon]
MNKNMELIKNKIKINNKFLIFLIFLFIIFQTLFYLDNQNHITIEDNALNIIQIIFFSLISILIVNIILKFTVKRVFFLFEKELEIEQRLFLTKLYSFTLYTIAITFIISQIGFTLTDITMFFSFIGIGIAFAIRDIILSFFAWLIILSKKPFRINDYIKIGDDYGIVDRIGTFFITLKTNYTDNVIKIPNKTILDKNFNKFNKNKTPDSIKITLSKIPKDFKKRKETLTNEIKKILNNSENISIAIEIRGDSINVNNINLILNYYTSFEKIYEVKNEIYTKFYELNKDIILIKKN